LGLREKRKGCINRERAGGTNGVDFRGQKEGSPKGVKSSKLIVYVICNLFEVRKWSVFFLEPCHRDFFFQFIKIFYLNTNFIFNVFFFLKILHLLSKLLVFFFWSNTPALNKLFLFFLFFQWYIISLPPFCFSILSIACTLSRFIRYNYKCLFILILIIQNTKL